MDLRALGIDLERGRVVLTLRGAEGDTAHELTGAAARDVIAALGPLRAQLEEAHGALRVLSANPIIPALRLETDRGTVLIEGPACEALLPLLREAGRLAARAARPRVQGAPGHKDDAALWERKYLAGSDGWELMRAPPPLLRWLASHPPATGAAALVPGCGRGHEARLLAAAGARVVAIDIAPSAIAACHRLAAEEGLGGRLETLALDVFRLPPAHLGAYDLVLEHCCFCAIDPGRRDEYVDAVAEALRPGGRLVGLFWCHDYPGGPPYGARREEVEGHFSRRFRILEGEVPADSILTRAGHELLLHMEKKDAL